MQNRMTLKSPIFGQKTHFFLQKTTFFENFFGKIDYFLNTSCMLSKFAKMRVYYEYLAKDKAVI